MYDLLTKITKTNQKVPYQPEYPLKYDTLYGPYKQIDSKESSMVQDFKFLLLTEPGEWPMNPDLGVGLRRYLFEAYNSESLSGVQARIQDQIEKYLPRINLLSAQFVKSEEEKQKNNIHLQVFFSVSGLPRRAASISLNDKGDMNIDMGFDSPQREHDFNSTMPLVSRITTI